MIDENFYIQLKNFFKAHGITQGDIAITLEAHQSFVSAMFNGKRSITRQTAQKLHDAYGLSVAWLLTGEGDMMAQPQPHGGTNINITRGGDVSVSGHHNVNSSGNTSGSDATLERLLDQNAQLIEQNKKLIDLLAASYKNNQQ